MYIIFNENNRECLRYFLPELPKGLKDKKYIKVDEIPTKEGFAERAILIDGELAWEYVEIPKTKEEIMNERIDNLEMMILLGGDIL